MDYFEWRMQARSKFSLKTTVAKKYESWRVAAVDNLPVDVVGLNCRVVTLTIAKGPFGTVYEAAFEEVFMS